MDHCVANLRNDTVRGSSMEQATLRRFLSGSTPARILTPEILGGGRAPKSGSVSARSVSPVKNSYFRNPTEAEEFCSPSKSPADGSEGNRTPEDLNQNGRVRKDEAVAVSIEDYGQGRDG
jgi:hypothetical protein